MAGDYVLLAFYYYYFSALALAVVAVVSSTKRFFFLLRLELFSHRRRHHVIMCNIQRFFSFNGKTVLHTQHRILKIFRCLFFNDGTEFLSHITFYVDNKICLATIIYAIRRATLTSTSWKIFIYVKDFSSSFGKDSLQFFHNFYVLHERCMSHER